jgi:hypothetical protein
MLGKMVSFYVWCLFFGCVEVNGGEWKINRQEEMLWLLKYVYIFL